MREMHGDLFGWQEEQLGRWIVITTNGDVRRDGACVMGRGVAKIAALKWTRLPYKLGAFLKAGNIPYAFPEYRVFTLPVKHHWREPADLDLVTHSTATLARIADYPLWCGIREIGLPKPGCGNGGLAWGDVAQRIAPLLDDRFVIVDLA